jgi:hypothetical protein
MILRGRGSARLRGFYSIAAALNNTSAGGKNVQRALDGRDAGGRSFEERLLTPPVCRAMNVGFPSPVSLDASRIHHFH